MAEKPPVVLTIAGFDPSSGAGVTADIKTIAAHSCYGVACITAMTVQSTSGVKRVEVFDPALVSDTLEELAADLEIAAVHIGMLGSAKVVKAVADFLSGKSGKPRLPNIVLDPVLKSSSGSDLLDLAGTKLLIDRLLPLARIVTPNIDEASVLTGLQVKDLEEMKAASSKLHEMGASAVVVTGGHWIRRSICSVLRPRGASSRKSLKRNVNVPTQLTGPVVPSRLPWRAIWPSIGDLPKPPSWPRPTSPLPSPTGSLSARALGPVHHLYRMNQQRRAAGPGNEPQGIEK